MMDFSAHKGAENGHRHRPWSLSSPSKSLVIAFCSAGLVDHLEGSALAYLVGINQLARRDQPETVVDQALHSHEPGALARRELDQGARQPPL